MTLLKMNDLWDGGPMRNKDTGRLAFLVLMVLVMGFMGASQAVATEYYVATTGNNANSGLSAGTAKLTIQAAVAAAAASDTIYVAAGKYSDTAMIDINKPLTLRGAQWGVNPTIGTRYGDNIGRYTLGTVGIATPSPVESTIERTTTDGNPVVLVSSPGVTIDGFAITDSALATTNNSVHGIRINTSTAAAPVRVVNNVVMGMGADSATTTKSIPSANGITIYSNGPLPQSSAVVSDNLIADIFGVGYHLGYAGTAKGIWLGSSSGTVPVDNVTISGNVIKDIASAAGGAWGIEVNAATSQHSAGLSVTGNTVDTVIANRGGTSFTSYARGIAIETYMDDLLVSHNKISNIVKEGTSALGLTAIFLGTDPVAGSAHVNLNSLAAGSGTGITVDPSAKGGKVDATNNWWGQATGPSAGQVSGSAVTLPWTTTYRDDPAKVGQPGFWPAEPTYSSPSPVSTGPAIFASECPLNTLHAQAQVVGVDVFSTVTLDPRTAVMRIDGVSYKTFLGNVGSYTGHWVSTEVGPDANGVYATRWTWVASNGNPTMSGTLCCYPVSLAQGVHNVTVNVTDIHGATSTDSWSFAIAPNGVTPIPPVTPPALFDNTTCTTNNACHVHDASHSTDVAMGPNCVSCHVAGTSLDCKRIR